MGSATLRVEEVSKSYGDEDAVDNISMTVENGEIHSILGPSGCGKTTTLRCIAGLETPDSGRIYVGDQLISAPQKNVHLQPMNRNIGMVFQEYAVWPHMSVRENVKFPLEVQDIGDVDGREHKVEETLELVGLSNHVDNLATNLSGGQQQRVAISRALVTEPDILLFDEPLSHLDAKLRREMRLEIERICEELNITTLYVTHDQDEAMYLSDTISLMQNGTIIEENDPTSLHTSPQTLFGMNFMGQCNTMSGEFESTVGKRVTLSTTEGNLKIPRGRFVGDIRFESEVQICFRPKYCRFNSFDDDEIELTGTVHTISHTGDFTEYDIELDSQHIQVRLMEPEPLDPGDDVTVYIDPEKVRVYPAHRPTVPKGSESSLP